MKNDAAITVGTYTSNKLYCTYDERFIDFKYINIDERTDTILYTIRKLNNMYNINDNPRMMSLIVFRLLYVCAIEHTRHSIRLHIRCRFLSKIPRISFEIDSLAIILTNFRVSSPHQLPYSVQSSFFSSNYLLKFSHYSHDFVFIYFYYSFIILNI